MPDTRETFTLEAAGTLSTGVKDRHQTAFSGDVTGLVGVVSAAPIDADLTADVKLDGDVVGTLTIADGETEGELDLDDAVTFGKSQTFELDITQVGSTDEGSDLEVTVAYTPR